VPTYQYVCTECGGQLEAVQKFTDNALTVHDDCGGRLRKVYSPVGIVFKGSGFYRTDSRGSAPSGSSAAAKNENGEKSEKSEKSDTSPSSGSDSSSSTSKTDSASSSSSSSSADSAKSSASSKSSSGEKVA
jgi:putative FmdB family regulatory protein